MMSPLHSDISHNWDLRVLHIYITRLQSSHTKAQCLTEIFYSKFFCDRVCFRMNMNTWIILNLSFLCLFKYPWRTRNMFFFFKQRFWSYENLFSSYYTAVLRSEKVFSLHNFTLPLFTKHLPRPTTNQAQFLQATSCFST